MKKNTMFIILAIMILPLALRAYYEKGFGTSGVVLTRDGGFQTQPEDPINAYWGSVLFGHRQESNEAVPVNENKLDLSHTEFMNLMVHSVITKTATGDVNGDGMDDIVHIYAYGQDIGTFDRFANSNSAHGVLDGIGDKTRYAVFDGLTGKLMYLDQSQHAPGYGFYDVGLADITGDGRCEIITLRHSGEDLEHDIILIGRAKDFFGDGSTLEVFTLGYEGLGRMYQNLLWSYSHDSSIIYNVSGVDWTLTENEPIDIMKFGDFDGNGRDDIAIVQRFGKYLRYNPNIRNSITLVLNGRDGSTMFHKTNYQGQRIIEAGYFTYILEVADMDLNGKDELIRVRYCGERLICDTIHPEIPIPGQPVGEQSYLDIWDVFNNRIIDQINWVVEVDEEKNNIHDRGHIRAVRVADVIEDELPELIYTRNWGTFGGLIVRRDIHNAIRTYGKLPFGDNHVAQLLDTFNFNSNLSPYHQIVATHEYYTTHSSNLRFFRVKRPDTGVHMINSIECTHWHCPPHNVQPPLSINLLAPCDFSTDDSTNDNHQITDLMFVEQNSIQGRPLHMKVVLDRDGNFIGDPVFTDQDFYMFPEEGMKWRTLTRANNDYKDRYLSRFFETTEIRNIVERIMSNTRRIELVGSDQPYYHSTNFLSLYSTVDAREGGTVLGRNLQTDMWSKHGLGDNAAIALRLHRIIATLKNGADMGYSHKLNLVKSLLSHAHYLASESTALLNNSDGMVYVQPYFGEALATIYGMNRINYRELDEIFGRRFSYLVQNQVNTDGVYKENSFYHSYLFVNYSFQIARMVTASHDNIRELYTNSKPRIEREYPLLARMYKYFMYAVKPLDASPNPYSDTIYRTDLPMYGDTYAYLNKDANSQAWYGKNYHNYTESVLSTPFLNMAEYRFLRDAFAEEVGITKLSYAAGITPTIPNNLDNSIAFTEGKVYVARNSWENEDGEYNHDAKHLHFKVGSTQPYPLNQHAHADFLSIELTANNENLIIDPAGFGSSTLPVNNFPDISDSYEDIYRVSPIHAVTHTNLTDLPDGIDELQFHQLRQYFKGNAVHSNLYMPMNRLLHYDVGFDVVDYPNNIEYPNYCWYWGYINGEFDEYTENAFEHYFHPQNKIDIVSGSVMKNGHLYKRNIFYVKPQYDNDMHYDYFIVDDFIQAETLNGHEVYQNWHLSPAVTSDSDLSLYQDSNQEDNAYFSQLSSPATRLKITNLDQTDVQPELVRAFAYYDKGYADNHSPLRPTKILSVPSHIVNGSSHFLTVIQTDTLMTLEETGDICFFNVRNQLNYIVPREHAVAYEYWYGDKHRNENDRRPKHIFQDRVYISYDIGSNYYVDYNNNGVMDNDESMFGVRFYTHRNMKCFLVNESKSDTSKDDFDNSHYVNLYDDYITVNWNQRLSDTEQVPASSTNLSAIPNPFNESLNITLELPKAAQIEISIYNVKGQKVKQIAQTQAKSGENKFYWDSKDDNGRKVGNGVYFIRVMSDNRAISTKKCMLVK
ncbi:MAG: FlgD immunoglobulin-like domain containing protein [Candidatus Cloacimonetes bacterium]|nr:FlgD immunoglobulin-like domain containing protein [Candidatus Cloacimonadota bacterium]